MQDVQNTLTNPLIQTLIIKLDRKKSCLIKSRMFDISKPYLSKNSLTKNNFD
jgi:hypothetical protein